MFPTDAEKARSRQIEDYYALYRGNFGMVLRYFRTTEEKKNQLEVVQNVAGMISRIFADLMFGEQPTIKMADSALQVRCDDFLSRNYAQTKWIESALTQSYAGKTYFEMYLKDGLAYFTELNPAICYPQFNSMFAYSDPMSFIISWELTIGSGKDAQNARFIKTHSPGLITYELRKISKGGIDEGSLPLSSIDPSLPEVEQTGLDYIPIYTVNNLKTARECEGLSDYDDIMSLFEELTRVQSQIATQLKKHADAKMAVPPGVLDEQGRIKSRDLEMFEVASSSEDGFVIPQYITNSNPLIDQAFKEQERVIEAIARVAEVSTVLMDWNVSGGTEKVGALRLRILRTLQKAKRKLLPYDDVIRDMISDGLMWEGGTVSILPKDVHIEFQDGLPSDQLEDSQIQTLLYGAGLQTLPGALTTLYGFTGDALAAKIKEIEDEQRKKNKAAMDGIPSFAMGA